VSIAPGSPGNHLHPERWEWLYPFHGTGFFLWEPHPGTPGTAWCQAAAS